MHAAWTAILLAAAPLPAQAAAPAVLAEYPGAFLENLVRNPAGQLVVTSYFDKTLLAGTGTGGFKPLAVLPAHPVGIAAMPSGYIVTAHGAPFTSGPGFTATNRILLLDSSGKVLREVAVPQAKFLNGLVQQGNVWLIADSIAATIWRFDPAGSAVTAWFADPKLAGSLATDGKPGANGLKLRDGKLYVSNSSRGTIETLAVSPAGETAGSLVPFAVPGAIDDFAFAGDGSVYVATHTDRLLAISPGGAVRTVMDKGCEACTAVALDGDGVVVLTTGNRASGGTLPARILRVKP